MRCAHLIYVLATCGFGRSEEESLQLSTREPHLFIPLWSFWIFELPSSFLSLFLENLDLHDYKGDLFRELDIILWSIRLPALTALGWSTHPRSEWVPTGKDEIRVSTTGLSRVPRQTRHLINCHSDATRSADNYVSSTCEELSRESLSLLAMLMIIPQYNYIQKE